MSLCRCRVVREYYGLGFEALCRGGLLRLVGAGLSGEERLSEATVLAGKFGLRTSLVWCAVEAGVPLSMRRMGRVFRFEWGEGFYSGLLEAQLRAVVGGGLEYAREFVRASTENKVWLLRLLENEGYEVGEELEFIMSVDIDEPDNLDSLRAYEASIHRAYYDALRRVLPGEYGFSERTRRPPRDPFSAALSFGNIVLYGYVTTALLSAGLDVRLGFLHVPFRERASLSFDVAEEFRQPVVDAAIIPLFTGRSLRRRHFRRQGEAVYLSVRGRGRVGEALRKRLAARLGGVPLLNHIRRQAERLAASLVGRRRYVGFRVHRYL